MALIYDAELTPSKPEVLAGWVPRQSWFAGDPAAAPTVLGSYRFDDPAGEVGIETFLVRFGDGPTLHVPLTYRGAPLEAATPILTMEHSVLGRRWVYDGAADPVYLDTLAAVISSGGNEAKLLSVDGSSTRPAAGPPVRVPLPPERRHRSRTRTTRSPPPPWPTRPCCSAARSARSTRPTSPSRT